MDRRTFLASIAATGGLSLAPLGAMLGEGVAEPEAKGWAPGGFPTLVQDGVGDHDDPQDIVVPRNCYWALLNGVYRNITVLGTAIIAHNHIYGTIDLTRAVSAKVGYNLIWCRSEPFMLNGTWYE